MNRVIQSRWIGQEGHRGNPENREIDEELSPSVSVQVCYPSCNYVIHQFTAVWAILTLDAVKVV